MKKSVAVLICALLLFGSVGCSQKNTEPKTDPSQESTNKTEAAAPGAPAEQKKNEVWKMCNGVSDTHPQSVTLQKFADEFSKATNGRITVEVYHNNSLGSEEELTEMARTNTLQAFFGNVTSGLPSFMPEFGVFALPYLFHSYEDAHKYLNESPKAKELWASLEKMTNLHFVGDSLNGSRALTTKDKVVKSPADLKGVMLRSMTAQVWQDVISALGATPVPIAYNELYVALQTGVVEGQDNGIANVYDAKFYEVQKYFYKTEHSYTLSGFFINSDAWKSLSADEQTKFTELFNKYCVDEYSVLMDDYYKEAEEVVQKAGMEIVGQDKLDMEAFYDSAAKMIDEKYMSNEKYKDIILDIRKYFGYK
ncbi:TRAP transporter substrate-binding protein [Petroclostridium sp. X23]|uniref:TRAP transporter substrate-binding protein n=1 Tax=Petroclostridium sp. X23 TaxID=3045146 RepID=UPI0024AC9AE1|nr:TRAP transporter substrate-binding protein [Petroclostridium sp. X23]WHH58544.1 TRAP transporter substrate-binding protein [Petroclostridium sp. X23]